MMNRTITIYSLAAALLLSAAAFGQYEIPWHAIGGGGASAPAAAIGGGYALVGTIGQPDASSFVAPMTGGTFAVVGGFWVVAAPSCACLGDMNGDGSKNAADIQQFVNCVIAGGSCSCADVDSMNGVTIDDTATFVDDLLAGVPCP